MKIRGLCLLCLLMASAPVTAAGVNDPSAADQVISLALGGEQRAYPVSLFAENPVVNDEVGHMAVVVFYDPGAGWVGAFFRLVGGEPLEFSGQAFGTVADDLTTATRWDMTTGQAVGGNLVGQKLIPIPARRLPFAEWRTKYPKGTVFALQ